MPDAEYVWDWFDVSPRGATYGVRHGDEVVCYTNRNKAGYDDAVAIAKAMNVANPGRAQAWADEIEKIVIPAAESEPTEG